MPAASSTGMQPHTAFPQVSQNSVHVYPNLNLDIYCEIFCFVKKIIVDRRANASNLSEVPMHF